VALLTHGYWQRKFASDSKIVGRVLSLNNKSVTIIGVLPESFDFTSIFAPSTRVDIIVPFPITDETDRWGNTLTIIGRLKRGVAIEAARAEFESLTKQIKVANPGKDTGFGATLTPMQERINRHFKRPFLVLLGAVACVLLIACANLSNLLLARNAGRRKEMAVRLAVGARRSHLIRQMLVESLLLAGAGAALGLPLAYLLTEGLTNSKMLSIPLLAGARVDTQALLFTVGIACATGLIFGVAPAIIGSRQDVHEDLKDGSRGTSDGARRAWLREILVISEVSLACVLLVAAGLLIRSFSKLLEVDPGFRAEHAVAWRIESARDFPNLAAQGVYYDNLLAHVRNIPGVQSVGASDCLPLGRNRTWGIGGQGVSYPTNQYPYAFPRIIDAGYLQTMQIALRSGRYFDSRDSSETEASIIVNERLSKLLFLGENCLNCIAQIGNDKFRVVGVVANVRHSSLDTEPFPEMYLLSKQVGFNAMELVVRSSLPLETLIPSVRGAIRTVDPELPTTQFQTLDELVQKAVSPKRLVTQLLEAFSALALVLAALGIYGVLSYSVNQRRQEMGIRLAIGAPMSAILNLVISQGMRLVLIGIFVGLAAALAASRLIQSLLYEVSATDPLTFVFNTVLLAGIALIACYLPARRASRTNPMVALRAE
jgi:putative ABC transport system permease protein